MKKRFWEYLSIRFSATMVVLIFLFTSCGGAHLEHKDVMKKNKVKSYTTTEYVYPASGTDTLIRKQGHWEFDKNGNEVLQEAYGVYSNGGFTRRSYYDRNGYLIVVRDSYPADTAISHLDVYFNNSAGKPLKMVSTNLFSGKDTSTTTYKYDDRGNCILTSQMDAQGPGFTDTMSYDAYGNMISSCMGRASYGWRKFIRSYDREGRMLSSKAFDEKGDPVSTFTFFYDDRDLVIRCEETDPRNKPMSRTVYSYEYY